MQFKSTLITQDLRVSKQNNTAVIEDHVNKTSITIAHDIICDVVSDILKVHSTLANLSTLKDDKAEYNDEDYHSELSLLECLLPRRNSFHFVKAECVDTKDTVLIQDMEDASDWVIIPKLAVIDLCQWLLKLIGAT